MSIGLKNNWVLFSVIGVIILGVIALFVFQDKDKTYAVTFDSTGGTAIEKQKVKDGDLVTKPSDPEKDNYMFVEWNHNGESFDFTTEVHDDITLKAVWKEIEDGTLVVKFDTNGGSLVSSQNIGKGEKVIKPTDPTKAGYKFVGWYNNEAEFDFDTKIEEGIQLTAKWEKDSESETDTSKKYKVTFNSNGGSSVKAQTIKEGSKATKPTNPTRSGYTFDGWKLNDKTFSFSTTITKDITLVASWTKATAVSKYTVTFDSNGGSSVANQNITNGQKATQPTSPTRSGYTFNGWKLNGSTFSFNTTITKDITLVASWTEVAKYTVTFNSNGGSSVPVQNITSGQKATQPANPTKNGYIFDGWKLNGNTFNFNTAITGNTTLTASWKTRYTVTVNKVDDYSPARTLTVKDNGSVITVSSIKYTDGTVLCSGSNPTVNVNDVKNVTNLIIVLVGGTEVPATIN